LDKAPDAFRTISEVADDLDIPQHVLRFWESRFAHIKPMKRAGGRRYYRPDDVDLLRGIRHLLYGEGYTIRGVQRILKEHGVKFVQGVWQAGAEQPQPAAGDLATEDAADSPPAISPTEIRSGVASGASNPDAPSGSGGGGEASGRDALRDPVAAPFRQDESRLGLGAEQVRQLQAVMDELLECRRLLEVAVSRSA
jgi:DNA-binding transcriptional MerR regulator